MAEEPLFVRVALNAWFVPLHIAAFIFQDRILRPRGAAPRACEEDAARRGIGPARGAVPTMCGKDAPCREDG